MGPRDWRVKTVLYLVGSLISQAAGDANLVGSGLFLLVRESGEWRVASSR